MSFSALIEFISWLAPIHLLGMFTAVHAVMHARTAQGSAAWVLTLVFLPYVSLPAYLIFGRGKFQGYVTSRREGDREINHLAQRLSEHVPHLRATLEPRDEGMLALERLAKMPFVAGNQVKLLPDGDATFEAIFAAIDAAEHYVLVEFFIVHDDRIGREFQQHLIDKARSGVPVYFLYDEVGCHSLKRAYLNELLAAGARVSGFMSRKRWQYRLQLNFRNHRKIVVVDGRTCLLGGLNVGDEYLGRSPRFGHWRDTYVQISGPAAMCTQLAFTEDWYWATDQLPEFNWQPESIETDQDTLILPTGPADDVETCGLYFVQAINSARERLWIASPYFVPDSEVVCALQLAALRGVDVRVMLPEKPDHLLVWLSSFSYLEQTIPLGVRIYRYQDGFLHQKVVLVDDRVAGVGTANLDNRSIRLNFEITAIVADQAFAGEVARMLEEDFAHCREVSVDDYRGRSFFFRFAVRAARLMSPIQ